MENNRLPKQYKKDRVDEAPVREEPALRIGGMRIQEEPVESMSFQQMETAVSSQDQNVAKVGHSRKVMSVASIKESISQEKVGAEIAEPKIGGEKRMARRARRKDKGANASSSKGSGGTIGKLQVFYE